MRFIRWFVLLIPLLAGCPKAAPLQTVAQEARAPGWQKIDGHACYQPPDFASLEGIARKAARGTALTEVTTRWKGEIDPAFTLPDDLVEKLENALLTNPERVDQLLPQDYEQCVTWAKGQLSIDDYRAWLRGALERSAREDCYHPPFEFVSQYLDIDRRWQIEVPMCRDEQVIIRVQGGQYTVEDRGDTDATVWITAEGDRRQPATEPSLPCHADGCFRGQLLGRFVDRAGHETVFPVNLEATFTAPAHGTLSFGLNDLELYDNRFLVKDHVTEYLLIEVRPSPQGTDGAPDSP
jgi:hypothetical protein